MGEKRIWRYYFDRYYFVMGKDSKYGEFSYKRPPHKKRTIRVDGAKEDDGQWFKCWNCGFMNNINRNMLGDGEGLSYSGGSVDLESHANQANPSKNYLMNISGKSVLLNLNPVFTERHNIGSDAVSGCSFCGSLNWR